MSRYNRTTGRKQRDERNARAARRHFARSFGRLPNHIFFSKAREHDTRCGAEAAAAALKCRPVFEGPDPKVKAFDVAKDGLRDGLEL